MKRDILTEPKQINFTFSLDELEAMPGYRSLELPDVINFLKSSWEPRIVSWMKI